MISRTELYREFLKFFWLRPENAVMFGVRAHAYATALDLFDGESPSIDVSCGDGIFSFITMGGRLGDAPDQFRAVSTAETFRSGDYDAFDHFDDTYLIDVTRPAPIHYTHGTDWKESMLRKAEPLNFYGELLHHDNNLPLPFSDGMFSFLYTNSSYWVNEFESHLNDLVRLARPGGHLVFQMRTSKIKDYSLARIAPDLGDRFHEIAEAGRVGTWRGLRSRDEVMTILDRLDGVRVVREEPVLGETIANIWNLGLRPLFNPLVKMANSIDVELRTEIKMEWCQIFDELFAEFVENYRCTMDEAFEYLIVLERTD